MRVAPDAEQCVAMRRGCACFNLRRAARTVTQHFNAVLAPAGLTATQFTILAALNVAPSSIAELAHSLAMDASTLSRNLGPLVRRKLLRFRQGRDRRARVIVLSASGRAALERAYPLWLEAQRAIEEPIGPEAYDQTVRSLRALTRSARTLLDDESRSGSSVSVPRRAASPRAR